MRQKLIHRIGAGLIALGVSVPAFTGRIAVSADGNYHDIDDWAATPVACALVAAAGLKGKLVHYDYNSHIAGSDADQGSIMKKYALEAVDRFGLNKSVFFDDMSNLSGSIASIAKAVNASSSSDPLFFIMAGPPEVLWRGVNASDPAKRQYVTVISHSAWNNNPHDTKDHPNMPHVKKDVEKLGVMWKQIKDQNRMPFYSKSGMGSYEWMKTSGNADIAWLYSVIKRVNDGHKTYAVPYRADFSDAGMMFYAITGKETTDMSGLKDLLLKRTGGSSGGEPVVESEPTKPNEPTPKPSSGDCYAEKNGQVMFELDDKVTGGFERSSKYSGFYGSAYLMTTSDHLGSPPSGRIEYKIRVSGGRYKVRLHNYIDGAGLHDNNDIWLAFSAGMTNNGWAQDDPAKGKNPAMCKTTTGLNAVRKWGWGARNACNRNTEWVIDLPAGEHTVYLAARSKGFAVDRIAIYKGSFNASAPLSTCSDNATTSLQSAAPRYQGVPAKALHPKLHGRSIDGSLSHGAAGFSVREDGLKADF